MPNGPFRHPGSPSADRSIATRIGILSTYPPKLCGLATFAAALELELVRAGNRVDIVRIDDGDPTDEIVTRRPKSVIADLVNGDASSIRRAAAVLSRSDVAIIQHEYGIFGGVDGDEVLDLMGLLSIPAIVVLHTVPLVPTPHQRSVLESVVELAERVVVMSPTAHERLVSGYPVDRRKVALIPHGAAVPAFEHDDEEFASTARPQLLTWGLLGPGKGIEHVIDALSLYGDMSHRPRYTVAGVTHPKVFARDGDEYRMSLIRRSWSVGVAGSVSFDDTYRDVPALTRFVSSATAIVLPYDSRDQVTSGVLVDAIAAGRPVVATAFPHAVELLASGAGIVVPHEDPIALAEAIQSLSDRDVLESMASEARRLAPSLSWKAVASRYAALADALARTEREPVAI